MAPRTAKQLCDRWMRLIQAEQRNARVESWWYVVRIARSLGIETPRRAARMHAINRANLRTERVADRAAKRAHHNATRH